jgi:ATP-dependent protease ClpP protease subunit
MKPILMVLMSLFLACSPVVMEAKADNNLVVASAEVPLVVHIAFNTSVNEMSVALAAAGIDAAAREEADVIVIEWNSPGGEVDSGFLLGKAIEESTVPVVCVVDGQADSMAFWLLQSCPVRLMTKRSYLMIHEASVGAGGKIEDIENARDLLSVLNRGMAEHIAGRMCVPVDEIVARVHGRDWWMGWQEALQVGAIDGVVPSVRSVLQAYQFGQEPVPTEVSTCRED